MWVRLSRAGDQLDDVLRQLRSLVEALPVPEEIGKGVRAFFAPDTRLAVRSSANGEDLEHLAGAGLYDSAVNVPVADAPRAVAEVWASLWTRRATLSRTQAGIPHEQIHMAVLIQELVAPELSFILHTAHPLTGDRGTAVVELAVGLGEVLASAAVPGAPYRLTCDRTTGNATLTACATFSVALRPGLQGGVRQERLDYARIPLSAEPDTAPHLGRRLAAVAASLEDGLGAPQDVEGVCVGEDIYVVQARPQQGLMHS
jgi:phosphoglucan,water dikinase